MALATELATPQRIKINGNDANLHPLSLYELSLVEQSYAASLRRQAIEATTGLADREREMALAGAARQVAALVDDIGPLLDWMSATSMGMIVAVRHCIDIPIDERTVAKWISGQGGMQSEVLLRWGIDSGLRSDPTNRSPAVGDEEKPSPTQA